MKKAYEDHVGSKIVLLDSTVGKVLRVKSNGYTIKTRYKKFFLSLQEIKLTKSGTLQQVDNYLGRIFALQHCGPLIDGTLVKITAKHSEDEYRYIFTTGCGGSSPVRCFGPLENAIIAKNVDGNLLICDSCGNRFKHKDMDFYHIHLKEKFKQGVICKDCLSVARPLFNIVSMTSEEDVKVGAREIKSFGKADLEILNTEVRKCANELSVRHGLHYSEEHTQIRDTAMEYRIVIKLPTDVEPILAPVKKKSTIGDKVKSKVGSKILNKKSTKKRST